jgi:hypothetical protein
MQEDRKRSGNQVSALSTSEEPHEVINWLFAQRETLESQIRRALGAYSQGHPVGRWAESITGIGPVISAGLLAHINMQPWTCYRDDRQEVGCKPDIPCTPRCAYVRLETVGHIWRFAGLDPTVTWEKGERRPWNADLKVLAWKIGESFVKVSSNDKDVYGQVYLERKALEQERNERGELAMQAADKLGRFNIGKDTDAYKAYSEGKLPPAHIHSRAKRYAVKLFLSHWFHVAYEVKWAQTPPKPYILTRPGHVHFFGPPNWPMQG